MVPMPWLKRLLLQKQQNNIIKPPDVITTAYQGNVIPFELI